MKSYKQLLEELSPEQKEKVDSWSYPGESEADKISSHVFPKGEHRMTIPLENRNHIEDVEPPHAVKQVLNHNGMKVKHYLNGIATDKHGRDISIGKVLHKSKDKHPVAYHAIKDFENDSRRSNVNNKNLQVVISKHPHDVAGMSTDRGWTSCMDMGGQRGHQPGLYQRKLQQDIAYGTHVAYLTHKGDHEAKNPIARIALKPHEGQSSLSHKILRPENTTYGADTPAFEHTVKKFADHHYPMLPTETHYKKNETVYNDSGKEHEINYDHPHLVRDLPEELHHEVAQFGKKEHQDQLIHSPNSLVRLNLVGHGHKDHLDHFVNDPNETIRNVVAQHGHKEHLDKLVNDSSPNVQQKVAQHGHKEHLDKLVHSDSHYVRHDVARHGYKDHLDHLIKNENDPFILSTIAKHGHKEHLDKLVDHPEAEVRAQVARNGDMSHATKLFHDPNMAVRMHAQNTHERLYNELNPVK